MKKILTDRRVSLMIAAALILATAGVILQMLSGAPYPTVPPVFFILLVPAALVSMVKRRWILIVPCLATLFLTLGLFTSGAYQRLFHIKAIGDSIGLWIQSLTVGFVFVTTLFGLVQQRRIDELNRG